MQKYNPSIHGRRSIRLKGYDYAQAGLYFITICVQDRECLFGRVKNDAMELSEAGEMIKKWYHELENKFSDTKCDEMVIMPNHIHFIIENVGTNNVGANLCVRPNNSNNNQILHEQTDILGVEGEQMDILGGEGEQMDILDGEDEQTDILDGEGE